MWGKQSYDILPLLVTGVEISAHRTTTGFQQNAVLPKCNMHSYRNNPWRYFMIIHRWLFVALFFFTTSLTAAPPYDERPETEGDADENTESFSQNDNKITAPLPDEERPETEGDADESAEQPSQNDKKIIRKIPPLIPPDKGTLPKFVPLRPLNPEENISKIPSICAQMCEEKGQVWLGYVMTGDKNRIFDFLRAKIKDPLDFNYTCICNHVWNSSNDNPIWSHQHALKVCSLRCQHDGGEWTGHWWTTVWGEHSVCQCKE